VTNATVTWLKSGGRRIDHGDSYEDMVSVGAGIRASGVPRSEMFITTKVGDGGLGLGAKDVNAQFEYYLQQVGISYVDLLLIHWPTSGDNSSTAVCQMHGSSYDATACRIDSWKALLAIMKAGKAKAVGVSNFNTGAFPSMN
jgi:diketogulonate reductase-like aldo/keto reductase